MIRPLYLGPHLWLVKTFHCHPYDVIRSRDVISHMTIRLSMDDFLQAINKINQTNEPLSCLVLMTSSLTSYY